VSDFQFSKQDPAENSDCRDIFFNLINRMVNIFVSVICDESHRDYLFAIQLHEDILCNFKYNISIEFLFFIFFIDRLKYIYCANFGGQNLEIQPCQIHKF
jgi:hypothetical protein